MITLSPYSFHIDRSENETLVLWRCEKTSGRVSFTTEPSPPFEEAALILSQKRKYDSPTAVGETPAVIDGDKKVNVTSSPSADGDKKVKVTFPPSKTAIKK